jgi:hypothetical protein
MPATDLAQKARPAFERPAVLARTRHAAQQLVSEIAVAVLDVDKTRNPQLGTARRDEKVADQAIEVVIGEHRAVRRERRRARRARDGDTQCGVRRRAASDAKSVPSA